MSEKDSEWSHSHELKAADLSKNNQGFALITGASSGIGEMFARRLAARGYNLALVARRVDRLKKLAEDLHLLYGITGIALQADLSSSNEVERVQNWIKDCPDLSILVNNAGFGVVGDFQETSLEQHLDMIAVHVLATVRLCHAVLPGMVAHHKGAIINVSSLSAFIPLGGNVTYGATKAYLNAFTESLAHDLRHKGIRLQALCPGFTYTGFHDTPPFEGSNFRAHIPRFLWMDADRVVDLSLRALSHGKVIYIPGFKNQLIALAARLGIISLLQGIIQRRSSLVRQPSAKDEDIFQQN